MTAVRASSTVVCNRPAAPGASWPEVMECYLMTGDFDYLIRVAVPDLHAYQEFLDTRLTLVKGVDNIRSSFSLKQVRYKTELPLDHLQI